MNIKRNTFRRLALIVGSALFISGFVACSDSSSDSDVLPPVEVVDRPVAVVQYDGSAQAQSDARTLLEIATKMTALRWALYTNLTDNFNAKKNYEGDIGKANWDPYFQLINDFNNNADKYVEAMQRLTDNGIWDAHSVAGTRAFNPPLKDIFMSFYNAGKVLDKGHEKIFTVINSDKKNLNTLEEWEKLFKQMPDEYKFGETDFRKWRNRVYNKDYGSWHNRSYISSKLYMYMCEEFDFYDAARDLAKNNDPRGAHIAETGHGLTKEGMNLNLALHKTFNPVLSNFSDGVDLGKASVSLVNAVDKGDPNGTRDAMLTITNVISTQVGGFSEGANYLTTEPVNITYEFLNQTIINDLNEAVADENAPRNDVGLMNIKDLDNTGADVYIIDNGNGKTSVALATNGEATVPFSKNGTYTVTGIDKNGNTSTTKVNAKTGGSTTVEVDTKKKDAGEENPKDGRISVSPGTVDFQGDEDEMTVTVTTNYRYYGVKADQDWITAVPVTGTNQIHISAPVNTTGKDRKGKVYVMATDSKGTILKTTAVNVYQERNSEGGVLPETTTMRFAYNAYEKTLPVELTGYEYLTAMVKNENDKSWLGAYAGATDRYVTVSVTANTTGKERKGVIYVIGTNTLDMEAGGYMSVEVTVIQEPEGKLSLRPNPVSFEADGGSVTLTATVEGYAKLGSFIDTDGQGWLQVTPNGASKTVDVTCKKNDTGKDRTGHFYVFATNFDNPDVGDIKQVKVEVKQTASKDNTARVSPSELSYPAEGGTQHVTVHMGKYSRSGYSVSNDGKGWVTVANRGGEKGFDITVSPNTTGAERTCTVNCHLTNSNADNPPADQIVTLPISITQEANEQEPGMFTMKSIASCEFTAKAMMWEATTGGTTTKEYKQTFTSPKITFTQDGSTLHVQASNNYTEKQYDEYQNIISFDIVNFSDNFALCKVENVSFRHVYANTYVDYTQPGTYGKGDDVTAELTRLEWQKGVSTYKDGGESRFVFSGSVANGVAFTKLTEKITNYTDGKPTQNFSYVENNNNSAMIVLKFTANGKSTSRMAAPWHDYDDSKPVFEPAVR